MAKVAIITASYGGYDSLKPIMPQEYVDAEWIVVSDDRDVANGTGWRNIYEPVFSLSRFRAAKLPKLMPWLYTDAKYTIWIDGSIRVKDPCFAAAALSYINSARPIAQFDSPNNCLYEEAKLSRKLLKYRDEPIQEQVDDYRNHGHPENWGLWATTVIVREDNIATRNLGVGWRNEIFTRSAQDQVSQPYVLRILNMKPVTLPGDVMGENPWVSYEPSLNHMNPVAAPYGFWEILRS